ncbi:MAG: amino acid ABC transporter permease [Paracoccaceae bacterium]|nr:MAG: amino acid ABC transporter permease [Alphaproteobacteria bacterium]GIX12985.1 MAG: amino acid ABC transporter permease [Paracoccaceae bacterium]
MTAPDARQAAPWAAGFLAALVVLLPFDFSALTGDAWSSRILIAAVLVANVWVVGRLPFRIQIVIAWIELAALFALFFWSFNLSYAYIWSRLPYLVGTELNRGFLIGAALTLFICFVAIAVSTIIALIAALARLSGNGIAVGIATFYISFFRGTPLLLQILLIYLGLPQLGVVLTPVPSAIIALSLCYGAYMAEIFRAGIQAIPAGQTEAARALGLKPGQIMRLVILPQAIRLIIPPTGNQFIAMLKDSSLVSVLGAWDLMYMARTHGKAEFKYVEMLIAAAVIYWILSMAFEAVQARIERHYGKGVAAR